MIISSENLIIHKHYLLTVSSCRDTLVTLFMNPQIDPDIKNNSNEIAYQIAKRTGMSFPLFDMVDKALFVNTGIID